MCMMWRFMLCKADKYVPKSYTYLCTHTMYVIYYVYTYLCPLDVSRDPGMKKGGHSIPNLCTL
jgi:hypothetical protein